MSTPYKNKRSRPASPVSNSFVKNVTSTVSRLLPTSLTKWFRSTSGNTNGSHSSTQTPAADATDSSTEDEAPETISPPAKRMKYSSPTHIIPTEVKYPSIRPSTIKEPPKQPVKTPVSSKPVSSKPVDYKEPCFKPALFGSLYYPGHTMYGGASMYMNQPNIKHRKTALVNDSNSSTTSTMSQSARRVMDLLENYSSPMMDAKRISQCIGNHSLNQSSTNKVPSYKTQELRVSNLATILRLKHKSRLSKTTNAVRKIIASQSSTTPVQKEPEQVSSNNSPLATVEERSLPRISQEQINETEDEPFVLPTAVLQISKDNLPTFNFGNFPQSSTTSTQVSEDEPLSKPETVFTNDLYKFSCPVRISSELDKTFTSSIFTFGTPELVNDMPKTDGKKDDDSSIVIGSSNNIEKLSVPISEDWKCPDCWVKNKQNAKTCACCGAKQPTNEVTTPPKCATCKAYDRQQNNDLCVHCDKSKLNNNTKWPTEVLKSVDASKWKCNDCWVSNDASLDKCACCGGKNPNKPAAAPAPIAISSNKQWKCEDCWILNKTEAEKCAACGGTKPGSRKESATVPSNNFNFTAKNTLIVPQSDKWECSSCLVRNDNEKTKCVCCQAVKPGLAKDAGKTTFNFVTSTPIAFKFGIDPKVQQTTSIKPSEREPKESLPKVPEESETNNNVLTKAPTFKFGIPAKKPDAAPKPNDIAATPKIGGFTFGISKLQTNLETPAPIVFGSSTKSTESVIPSYNETNKQKEQSQEVPKVDFNFGTSKKPEENTIFGSALSSQNIQEKIGAASSLLKLGTEGKKDTVAAPELPSAPVKPTGSFTFACSLAEKPSSLSAPSFSLPSKPTTAVAPVSITVSPFSKTAASRNASISLFSSLEPTPTASSTALPATSPVFNFGSNSIENNPNPPANSSFRGNSLSSAAPQNFADNSMPSAAPQTFGENNNRPAPPQTFGENSMGSAPSTFGASGMTSQTFGNNGMSNSTPTFGGNLPSSANATQFSGNALPSINAQTDKPSKFNFSFVGSTTVFNQNTFGTTSNNTMSGSESAVNALVGPATLTPKLGGEMHSATEMSSVPNFGSQAPSDNHWPTGNTGSSNMFSSNANTNPVQQPVAFTFGAGTLFNSNNNAPAFNSETNSKPPLIFGINQPPCAQSTQNLFASPAQSQPAAGNPFGGPPLPAAAPSPNPFGTPHNPSSLFGTPASIMASPAPTFTFGSQPPSGVFGFGQTPQPTQMASPSMTAGSVYSFGSTPSTPQVQFNMGSAPAAGARRVRKAVRRNPQR